MRRLSARATTLAFLATALPAIGCGSSGPVDDFITAPLFVPPSGVLDGKRLVVPKGRALAFVAQPMGGGETLKEHVELAPRDAGIAGVEKTVEMNQFVLIGVSAGTTELTATDESGASAAVTFQVEVVE